MMIAIIVMRGLDPRICRSRKEMAGSSPAMTNWDFRRNDDESAAAWLDSSGNRFCSLVTPAKAGVQLWALVEVKLDSGLRRNDDEKTKMAGSSPAMTT